jgi:hypothetical protein
MTHKASTLVWSGVKSDSQVLRWGVRVVLGLLAVALVAAGAYAVLPATSPEGASGAAAGVEASSARWAAMGSHFEAQMRARAADTARWAALGEQYGHDYRMIAAIDSARWSALGRHYQSRVAAGVRAGSARWAALGRLYGITPALAERSAETSAERWSALGASYMARYEAATAASSARYQALAEYYAEMPAAGR